MFDLKSKVPDKNYFGNSCKLSEERQEFMAFAREMSNDDVARYNFILAGNYFLVC